MIVNDTVLAWFGVSGTLCDAIGGLYLAYELLGGARGPLGLITRAATYGLIFALGYGLAFGPFFGMVAGVGIGCILAFEFWRVAWHQRTRGASPLYHIRFSGAARGLVFGLASMRRFGWEFASLFGILTAVFLFFVYHFRFAPTHDYEATPRLRLTRHSASAAFLRALAIGAAGALTSYILERQVNAVGFGLAIGLAVGLISLVGTTVSPIIEWRIENLPERTLAAVGFSLIALGLLFQSVQYLAVIFSAQ